MFNNSKPNIIFLSDNTDVFAMTKPIGPYKVANALRQNGFEVAVIHHLSIFSISEIQHMLEHLVSDQTLFIGINNFYYSNLQKTTPIPSDTQIVLNTTGHSTGKGATLGAHEFGAFLPHGLNYNKEIRDLVKKINPKTKFIVGGPLANDLDYNADFDYVLVGFSESSIVNLANHLLDPLIELKKSYKSVYGPVIVDDAKAPSYDFTKEVMTYQDHDVVLPKETLTLEIGRGCIFNCSFCSYPLNGKKKMDFIKDADLIYNEMVENYQRFGVTRYIFCDDTFNDSIEKCHMIYEISQRLPFKLEYWAYIRLDLLAAHPETADWLFNSGLKCVSMGVETLNPKTASFIGKGGNRTKQLNMARNLKKTYGDTINLSASFMYGLPYETVDSLKSTSEFLLSDQNPFDTWTVEPLVIQPSDRVHNTQFRSDIDRNWMKYGYRDLGTKEFYGDRSIRELRKFHVGNMIWENDQTNFLEMVSMVQELRQKAGPTRLVGSYYNFMIAGLGVPLETTLNKHHSEVDWDNLDRLKLQRANSYKQEIFKKLKIPKYYGQKKIQSDKFSKWLLANGPFDGHLPVNKKCSNKDMHRSSIG
jgi:hypothetical protein